MVTSLRSEDLGWRLGLIPNLSIKVYARVDGERKGGQSRIGGRQGQRNTGRGKEMGRERERDSEKRGKRDQFKAREHISFNKVRKSRTGRERER